MQGSEPRAVLRREADDGEVPGRKTALAPRRTRSDADARWLCRRCGSPVTSDAERTHIEGRHVHRRRNPAEIVFEFGCFLAAPGVARSGRPTSEWSWFAGYRWTFAHCRECSVHLGWHFEGRSPAFHALILDRLAREREDRAG